MKVVITERLDDTCAAWLAERCDVQRVAYDDPAFAGVLAEADALVVRTYTIVDAAFLGRVPKLKVVGRAGVGLDNIDLDACRARGVRVVHTPDANTQAVVEYVFGLLLDRYRPRTDLTPGNAASFHTLRQTEVGTQLDQLTLGIFGFGRIGKRLGKAASAMGIPVLAHDLLPADELRTAVDYDIELVDRDTLLNRSDIVTLHVDGRAANRQLFNAALFEQMKPDALFLNAARGMLVDHSALAGWLRRQPDAFAVLDVHDPEPVPSDSTLFTLPNARLLPHLASRTGPALENMSWVVKDVWKVLSGEEPAYPAV